MYTYGCFMLRFDRKQQNSVQQLSFNKKNKLKTNKQYYSSFKGLGHTYMYIHSPPNSLPIQAST